MATSDAPISIGQVALTVRDLDQMTAFYEEVIGLGLVVRNGNTALLGSDRGVLLELQQDRLARPYPQEAGLFHTAFLLPSRQDLGAWLVHADKSGVRITGASHHGVSEALYLDDPEGNGIEIYRDLPRQNWTRTGGQGRNDHPFLGPQSAFRGSAPLDGGAGRHRHRACASSRGQCDPSGRIHHRRV